MEISNLKQLGIKMEDELKEEIEYISNFIFNNPELGGDEYLSSKFLCGLMEKHGFEIEYPYCNIDTAFRAEISNGEGPVIAFLAEYDALPGYGANGEAAHACGHNWIAAHTAGAAIVLSKLMEHFKGTIVLMGTPAEETYGAKVDLVKEGAFKDINIVFQAHLEGVNNINYATFAMDAVEISFKGKAAHAATYPHEGINAHDGVQLTFAGINALRQHIRTDSRIHGITTYGGDAPNIVPDKASCRFYTRAASRDYCNLLTQKLINCAKGASMMTGAEMEYKFYENSLDNLVNIPVLQGILKNNLDIVGINEFYSGNDAPAASTDIGNVSNICPTMYMEVALDDIDDFYVHDAKALTYVNSDASNKKLHQIVKAFVGSSLDILCNPLLHNEIQESYKKIIEKNKLKKK